MKKTQKKEKDDISKVLTYSLILLLGITLGITLSLANTFALDTATPDTATTSNATDSNATDSNATNSNATDSNATDSNATTSNATAPNATDGNVYLDSNKIYINEFKIDTSSANIGEKVKVDLCTNINITNAKLLFKSEKGNQFTVYLNNLNDEEYIEIPATVVSDTYYLAQLILESDNIKTTYTNINDYDFNVNIKIEVPDNNTTTSKKIIYNNEDVNEENVKEITEDKSKQDITINATGNNIVSKEVFKSIKGQDKNIIIKYKDNELVFNGKDIEKEIDIDASIEVICITNDEQLSNISTNGYIINLANNKELPGVEKVRIKATTEMKDFFNKKNIYLYYYDEDNNKFTLINDNVSLKDDYYEFNLEHNSKYILTNNKITNKELKVDNNVVNFTKTNNHYLLLIGLVSLLIVIAVITIILLKKKEKN